MKCISRLILSLVAGLALVTPTLRASDWTGPATSANWNSTDVSGGWTVGVVPNSIGATANFAVLSASLTVTLSAAAITGTIDYSGNTSSNLTITPTNALTLNQNSTLNDAFAAFVTNSNSTAGTNTAALILK